MAKQYSRLELLIGKEALEKLKITKQSTDEGEILVLVNKVLDDNPQSIVDFKNGKDRATGFLIGQVMKLSKGTANPGVVAKLVNIEIRKR